MTEGITDNNPKSVEIPNNGYVTYPKLRSRLGLTMSLIGFIFFLIGSKPEVFGLDRGTSIGFVQIYVILIGIGLLSWGASVTLLAFWKKDQKSLLADFGTRVISTGVVICAFTALADAFGFGTNPLPNVYLGKLQSYGVMIGMGIIIAGIVMLLRFKQD